MVVTAGGLRPAESALMPSSRRSPTPSGRAAASSPNSAATGTSRRWSKRSRRNSTNEAQTPWHFPTLGAYTSRLEDHGFGPRYAELFDRPTELDDEGGLRGWLGMFGDSLLAPLSPAEHDALVDAVEERLRTTIHRDGRWVADYRRLRFRAVNRPG